MRTSIVEFRVVVAPVDTRLWKILDSTHPQVSIEYADRRHAVDCARGLATENAPSLVEVLTSDGRVELRERYLQTAEGCVRVELVAFNDGSALRSA